MLIMLLRVRNQSVPEQLKWSQNNNKVKWLHIEGESDQTQEGKHRHGEIKSGQTSTVKITTKTIYMLKYIFVLVDFFCHIKASVGNLDKEENNSPGVPTLLALK